MSTSLIKRIKGFTLIELLIVITIIGILAVALVPRISQGPARARDVARKADLSNIASALELYHSDKGQYPGVAATAECIKSGDIGSGDELASYLKDGNIPEDPGGGTNETFEAKCTDLYYYLPENGKQAYALVSELEVNTSDFGGGIICDAVPTWNATDDDWDLSASSTCAGDGSEDYFYMISSS
jgi:prepilin-type N-terminal cleavage/methylation domain-containing protein